MNTREKIPNYKGTKPNILTVDNTISSTVDLNFFNPSGTSTANFNNWSFPTRQEVIVYPDRIEIVYTETSKVSYTVYPSPEPDRRVFKVVYSCVKGKWNESGRIYGEIISPSEETYEFEDE